MKNLVAPTMAHKAKRGARNFCTYTVYNNETDFPVIVDGKASECAKAMGIALSTFWSNISKCENGICKRWKILKRYVDGKPDYNRRGSL